MSNYLKQLEEQNLQLREKVNIYMDEKHKTEKFLEFIKHMVAELDINVEEWIDFDTKRIKDTNDYKLSKGDVNRISGNVMFAEQSLETICDEINTHICDLRWQMSDQGEEPPQEDWDQKEIPF